jgi:hypothetical protein
VQQAKDAYETLAAGDSNELNRILDILAKEQHAVAVARENHEEPSKAFARLGDSLSYEWNEATGGAPASEGKLGALRKQGRYLKLALVNMDHFGRDAVRAYMAVHTYALSEAAKLRGSSLAVNEAALRRAYAINAFGDHFLSDLFAAGHVRTPRRALYEMSTTIAAESGLLARIMHNEDNRRGVHVSNGSDTWTAYGDGWELDTINTDNWQLALRALEASASEVYAVASGGALPSTFTALHLTPALEFLAARPQSGGPNDAPLFWADPKDYVYRRGGLGGHWDDVDSFDYTYYWSAAGMTALQAFKDLLPVT